MNCLRKTTIIIIVIISAVIVSYGQEVRYILKAKGEMSNNNLEYGLKLQFRNNLNTERLIDRTDMGGKFDYNISKKMSFSSGFRYSHSSNKTEEEDNSSLNAKIRAHLDWKYKNKKLFDNSVFYNRLRLQYNTSLQNKYKYYIRNKFLFEYNFSKQITPYLAIEPYFSIDDQKIKIIRIYAGNEFKLFGRKIDFFLISEMKNKYNGLNTYHIFGLTYNFKL